MMRIAIIGKNIIAEGLKTFLEQQEVNVVMFREGNKIARVHKRFISKDEKLTGSRIQDLFRIVTHENPEQQIEQQIEAGNEEIFSKLSEMELSYLKSRYENFQDFDLVINIPAKSDYSCYAGPANCLAIGESNLSDIVYNPTGFDWGKSTSKEIALIGESTSTVDSVERMISWLITGEGKRRVFYITSSLNPLNKDIFKDSIVKLNEFEEARITLFMESLRAWQELEDYEKVKVKKPEEPIPALVYFSGHEVTAISKLSDQDNYYLTCEIPEFRKPEVGFENSQQPLKTIAVEKVIVAKGAQYNGGKFKQMLDPIRVVANLKSIDFEPGFIELGVTPNGEFIEIELNESIKLVDECLHHYFTKVD